MSAITETDDNLAMVSKAGRDRKSAASTRANSGSSIVNDDNATSSSSTSNFATPSPLHASSSMSSFFADESYDAGVPPPERMTIFDLLDNLEIPQRLERLQSSISAQKEKVRQQRLMLSTAGADAKGRVVDQLRRRVASPEEQLDHYRLRVRKAVDRLGRQWNNQQAVSNREKLSFCAAVMNIFISGYLIGGHAQWFPLWYTLQLLYFMPVRFYTYQKRGYHYFLADLCYFTNALLLLSIWVIPNSKRLFLSVYCLAFGNNAIAIAMWKNMLVFHSLDKVTSLFIHIMPCATLHCLVHLLEPAYQEARYPAIYAIKHASRSSPEHYSLSQMMFWASIPYMIWQLFYHAFITVKRREKIAAGRPTSFTYLRKSYSSTWIGKLVLSLPQPVQETAFMFIQYSYALLTMTPCPFWFKNREASAIFLLSLFAWSVYGGAKYYIEFFGRRFQDELESLKKDIAKLQSSPEGLKPQSQPAEPKSSDKNQKGSGTTGDLPELNLDAPADKGEATEKVPNGDVWVGKEHTKISGIDAGASGAGAEKSPLRERR